MADIDIREQLMNVPLPTLMENMVSLFAAKMAEMDKAIAECRAAGLAAGEDAKAAAGKAVDELGNTLRGSITDLANDLGGVHEELDLAHRRITQVHNASVAGINGHLEHFKEEAKNIEDGPSR
jgi:hypothetical protein